MRVLITCDDVGMTSSATSQQVEAWRSGLVDGLSIVANGAAVDDLEALLASEPAANLRVAVHLNLSEGPPTAAPREVADLLSTDGWLDRGFVDTWLGAIGVHRRDLLRQVRREWQAQIDRVRRAIGSRRLSALDGHRHVHMPPPLFELAARLAADNGIPEIRISREPPHLSRALGDLAPRALAAGTIKHAVLRGCARHARTVAGRLPLSSPDWTVGVLYSGRLTRSAAAAGVAAARTRTGDLVEVVCHLGRALPDELKRWQGGRGAWRFYCHPNRDRELAELKAWRSRCPR
ncbi:MAG: ChbG/HpnK family deacetylase [Deltaproteobacteria bacterium]|jgi:predicted glycoside hydrolase/deacetylase ChbG (UPF0249 family)|nr:ChbG/HpnK family deacetylase [Deltaproteobacteria bacterium]MBW2531981.1 ChbG/HpnK family deacetylase [Deltaproteobacteria bacterium]